MEISLLLIFASLLFCIGINVNAQLNQLQQQTLLNSGGVIELNMQNLDLALRSAQVS
jgi:hypothetical protein